MPDLADDARVERRDALRGGDARHHVVEALRAENHLERRALAGLVERDEPRSHRALAGLEVVARNSPFHAVFAQVLLNPRELELGEVVALNRRLERRFEPVQLGECLQPPRPVSSESRGRSTPGVPRRARDKSLLERTAPAPACENGPLPGFGTGAPDGAGTSRDVDRTRDFGRSSTSAATRAAAEARAFPHKKVDFGARTVVRSRPVLGQAHWPTRRLLAAAALVFAVLAIPALGVADSGRSTPSLRAQAAALAAKSRSATLGLYALDQQLANADARLQSLRAQTATLRGRRASLALRLAIARRGATIAQQRLGSHVRALYERGDVSTLEVVFGASSLDDALTSIDDLHRMARQDAEVLAAVKATRAQLTRAAANLAAQAAALRDGDPRSSRNRRLAHPLAGRAERLHRVTVAAAEPDAGADRGRRRPREGRAGPNRRDHARTSKRGPQRPRPRRRRPWRSTRPRRRRTATVLPPTSPVAATPGERRADRDGDRLRDPGQNRDGSGHRLGHRRGRPDGDPARNAHDRPGYGEAVAADIGSGVVGDSIDLWFPTVAQANAWGRRTVTIVLH